MIDSHLKVPKQQMTVSLWVHPEGKVLGQMFLSIPDPESRGRERPEDVLNSRLDFLVFKLQQSNQVRFYNKSSIVRVEYNSGQMARDYTAQPRACRITMMDGALLDGEICKALSAETSRLYDYLNDAAERFLPVTLTGANVALVNKAYIVSVNPLEGILEPLQQPRSAVGVRDSFS